MLTKICYVGEIMSEELLIRQCAPTLAGIKTGNIFNCDINDYDEFKTKLRALNKKLSPKGLRILPLKHGLGRAMVYLYRPEELKKDFSNPVAVNILKKYGYNPDNVQESIILLIKKLRSQCNFPHEIGLFLGYPPDDVKGFIDNNASNSKYVGCWKVYNNVESAIKTFKKYNKCSCIYYDKWLNGRRIEYLAVKK